MMRSVASRCTIPISHFVLALCILIGGEASFSGAQSKSTELESAGASSTVSDGVLSATEGTLALDGNQPQLPHSKPLRRKGINGVFDSINETLKPIDGWFGTLNGYVGDVIFYPVPIAPNTTMPAAVMLLISGAIYFTVRMGFINFRGFVHAIKVTGGKYDDKNDPGEVSHFQALTTALSATVGLGNIAGVATAVTIGGPGATFWMIVAGLLGMSSKFVECTLGQKYRQVRSDGTIMGGAMYYLPSGFAELGIAPVGRVFGGLFAILCIGASFGGGNAYQVNGSLGAVSQTVPFFTENPWAYGLIMVVLTGIVIIGGIRRIASVAEKIVPIMCSVYVLGAVVILLMNASKVPEALQAIFVGAFTPAAYTGGFFGVLIQGFRRAAFSNEAGVGSAAIAHSAAKTDYPIREGLVALLEPFIDTVVICTMTALVIVITGAYDYTNENTPIEFRNQVAFLEGEAFPHVQGAALTSMAMDSQIPYFRYVLAFATFLFAYSTMISWSYYGERCWTYLFGDGWSLIYRLVFLGFTFMGSVISVGNVLDFSDLMIFGMMIPNMIGLFLLSNKVKADLDVYWSKLKSGELDREL
ncbi:MAG: alanine/glycine:cation symporter family protein [Pirellulaceae bacterium]|nr:alanine/glycine:cation symporter family protein [Pirellulaceae bacterium]